MRTPTIVVGTDGSAAGNDAVRWAAREAARRRMPLRVVHVLDTERDTAPLSDFAGNDDALSHELAGIVATAGVTAAREAAPGVDVRPLILTGHPAACLVAAAENADLLVVGSHHRGRIAGPRSGSVSRHVARHARCPVIVVGRGDDPPIRAGKAVPVGGYRKRRRDPTITL